MRKAPRRKQNQQQRVGNLIGGASGLGKLIGITETDEGMKRNPQQQEARVEQNTAQQRVIATCGGSLRIVCAEMPERGHCYSLLYCLLRPAHRALAAARTHAVPTPVSTAPRTLRASRPRSAIRRSIASVFCSSALATKTIWSTRLANRRVHGSPFSRMAATITMSKLLVCSNAFLTSASRSEPLRRLPGATNGNRLMFVSASRTTTSASLRRPAATSTRPALVWSASSAESVRRFTSASISKTLCFTVAAAASISATATVSSSSVEVITRTLGLPRPL